MSDSIREEHFDEVYINENQLNDVMTKLNQIGSGFFMMRRYVIMHRLEQMTDKELIARVYRLTYGQNGVKGEFDE